jgi:adenosylcobinamide kinase/adenosylcobinamide-phosphate guanylyltransferase
MGDAGLTLLLGGARSGKSALAVRWAQAFDGPVTVLATAEGRDDEMRARIAAHRSERPADWVTVEEPRAVPDVLAVSDPAALVVVDCLTLWVANLLDRADAEVLADADALGRTAAARRVPTVVVSNEVGWGIVPADPSTRRYRDLLGGVNRVVAGHAGAAWLLVAGRVLALHEPPPGVTRP